MSKYSESSDQDDSNHDESSRKETRVFMYDAFNINYLNTSQISHAQNAVGKDVQVENYLCNQQGNSLYKITQIYFQDRVVRIEDKFQVDFNQTKNDILQHGQQKYSVSKNSDKVRIFYNDSFQNLQRNGKNEKKDKKNIVKNIVKIFISWLEKKKSDKKTEQYAIADAELKKMLRNENFNNRLVKEIVANENINKLFLKFLLDSAEEQVKYSRIHDKESHYQALELYKRLLENKFKENDGIKDEKRRKEQQKLLLSRQHLGQTRKKAIFDTEAKIEEQ